MMNQGRLPNTAGKDELGLIYKKTPPLQQYYTPPPALNDSTSNGVSFQGKSHNAPGKTECDEPPTSSFDIRDCVDLRTKKRGHELPVTVKWDDQKRLTLEAAKNLVDAINCGDAKSIGVSYLNKVGGNISAVYIDDKHLSEDDLIGKGAFGSVYRVVKFGCNIVVKKNRPGVKLNHNEVSIPLKLEQSVPGVVKVLGLKCVSLDTMLIFMEDAGSSLRQWLTKPELCCWLKEEKNLLKFAYSFYKILAALEGNNVVHTDLKPENVCLSWKQDGMKITIIDFGSAAMDNEDYTDNVGHTHEYLPPGILSGSRNLKCFRSEKCDVYAAAIVIATIFNDGRHPIPLVNEYDKKNDTERKEQRQEVKKMIIDMEDGFFDELLCKIKNDQLRCVLRNTLCLKGSHRWTAQEVCDYLERVVKPCEPTYPMDVSLSTGNACQAQCGEENQTPSTSTFASGRNNALVFTQDEAEKLSHDGVRVKKQKIVNERGAITWTAQSTKARLGGCNYNHVDKTSNFGKDNVYPVVGIGLPTVKVKNNHHMMSLKARGGVLEDKISETTSPAPKCNQNTFIDNPVVANHRFNGSVFGCGWGGEGKATAANASHCNETPNASTVTTNCNASATAAHRRMSYGHGGGGNGGQKATAANGSHFIKAATTTCNPSASAADIDPRSPIAPYGGGGGNGRWRPTAANGSHFNRTATTSTVITTCNDSACAADIDLHCPIAPYGGGGGDGGWRATAVNHASKTANTIAITPSCVASAIAVNQGLCHNRDGRETISNNAAGYNVNVRDNMPDRSWVPNLPCLSQLLTTTSSL